MGRAERLSRFGANLELPVEDPRRRFVFCIHGDGGVGKTFLTRQLQRIATDHGAIGALVWMCLADEQKAAEHLATAAGLLEQGTTVEAFAMLILCRVAQRDSSQARRLALQFRGLPPSRYVIVGFAADLAELAGIPGVDQVLVEEIRTLTS